MRFEFATASRILFGVGVLKEAGAIAAALGRRAFVVTEGDSERAATLLAGLKAASVEVGAIFAAAGEPTLTLVSEGVGQARAAGCDLVIGIGGGSVMDTGKAIAALLTNGGDPLDYLEVIGRGQPLKQPAAPCIAIPTTAGTGAEVTANAVLASPEHRQKVSLRSPLMIPRVALVDPQLTYSMPPALTASTGLDALTQVLEPYVSRQANPFTDTFCREGLMRAAHSLHRAWEDGADVEAREDMALVSLCGGLALANAKLGAVHGLAGVLGGMFDAPHGALCGRLLPYVMEATVRALQAREPDNPALERYDDVAVILTGEWEAEAEDGVAWVQELCAALKVPGLATYGVRAADFPTIIEKAAASSSMKGNPITLTTAELRGILSRAL
ncbi:MAG TPA: iron-containing alcohol dehydrogenase [Anaerolineae bacterium]|nr:iron-containing alcohol dehydrogenase [Anaerolineae bacterium]HQI85332.1 iron-containing alcohol dehydrogenase [Anaerolineae bacterium]